MRKFGAFMLLTVLALGFTGCAQPAPKAPDAPKADAPKEEPKKEEPKK